MPTNHTANYNLNQWVKSDQVKMEDFNADNTKIDSAIKAAQQKADNLATSKADVSALNAEITARTTAVTAETNARKEAVTAEANTRKAAVNAEASTRAAEVAALNTAVAKLGNCQIQHFSYTGNGGTQTLTFTEKPLLILIMDSSGGAAVFVHGVTQGRVQSGNNSGFWVSWTENSLSWSVANMNGSNTTYHGIAFFGRE